MFSVSPRARPLNYRSALSALFAACAFVFTCTADTLRVTSLNLLGATNGAVASESAEVLKRLDPDIILLQGVRDWKFCHELSELLKPSKYFVLVCSTFSGNATLNQAAVLSKYQGYFSWAQAWRTESSQVPGGFVFVALDAKGHKVGFFSAVVGSGIDAASLQPMLEQARTAANWEANRVQAMCIALGTASTASQPPESNPGAILAQEGYSDAFGALRLGAGQLSVSALADLYLVQSSVFPNNPTLSQILSSARSALTCDLELDPARAASSWTARAEELQRLAAENLKRQQAVAQAQSSTQSTTGVSALVWRPWTPAAAGLLVFGAAWYILRRRRPNAVGTPRLIPENLEHAMTYTVVVDSPSGPASTVVGPVLPDDATTAWQRRAIAAEAKAAQANYVLKAKLTGKLAAWLKQKFMARLVSDRNEMLATQHDAALRAMNVDERLAKVESQIQLQTRKYQQKIDDLTLELQAAREENRELIRARIAQIKLEMDTVRARVMAEAGGEQR